MKYHILFITLVLLFNLQTFAQKTDSNIFGDVKSEGEHIPFATVYVKGTTLGTATDETGHYHLINLPVGQHILIARAMGYKEEAKEVLVVAGKSVEVNFELERETMALNEVVITGTKTFQRQTEAPVIVNVIDKRAIQAVQACNISEGLRFQSGLRVETDCQTCNYTQLRMNGLGGGYSQILINGRPIISPLVGLYGLEQIPSNMLERIEVVRGGGSALYGSSAVGGTVNIITQIPRNNHYDVSYTHQQILNKASDKSLNANLSMVSKNRTVGSVIFVSRRQREAYDHPGITLLPDGGTKKETDNFSDLPELSNNSFGFNLFYKPKTNQKLEVNFSSLYEYRYGGEITEKPAYLALQAEERVHQVLMGGLDYQLNFNQDKSSFITYFASQRTERNHYTGLYPVRSDYGTDSAFHNAESNHLLNPPYGFTSNTTMQGGVQLNHRLQDFIAGKNVLTIGAEYLHDEVIDSIRSYAYGLNQKTSNMAAFLQSNWQISKAFSLLLGLRSDKHNLLSNMIFSPRVSVMYGLKRHTQFRVTWGTGFRAPQSFDADMHIAFAGGGVSRIVLAPGLKEERSNSLSASVNFDKPTEKYIWGFTADAFYTRLSKAFFLKPFGEDEHGTLYEKQNGPGAVVRGMTLEVRANYMKKAQIELGYTYQKSVHEKAVETIEGLEARKEFLRSPDQYGYAILTLTPNSKFSTSLSSLFTGSMLQAKYSTDESLQPNEYKTSASYTEINIKMTYTIALENLESAIEIFGGVKNMTNVFQADLDNYRNRDSNYIYGPGTPRMLYLGLRLKSI
jgi:outer membrane receptor for ferrienterochelin and colicins